MVVKKYFTIFVALLWISVIVIIWAVPSGVWLNVYGKFIARDVVWDGIVLPKVDGYFVYPGAKPEYLVVGHLHGSILEGVQDATITISRKFWDGYGHDFEGVIKELCRLNVECVRRDVVFIERKLTMIIPMTDNGDRSGYLFDEEHSLVITYKGNHDGIDGFVEYLSLVDRKAEQ